MRLSLLSDEGRAWEDRHMTSNSSATFHPATAPSARRPGWLLLGTEPWRAASEFIAWKVLPARAAAVGDGHPVIIFPGLASDGRALAPLRAHCRSLGYNAMDWGRGWNTGPQGPVDPWLDALASDVESLLAAEPRAPTLIGWSLGGIYARELAKRKRLRVRQVITIGTPFSGYPDQTHAAWMYRLLSGAAPPRDAGLQRRLRTPPDVPTTSIYSRNDGIVPWQACKHDNEHDRLQDVEVAGSHLGMGWNPQVLAVVADRLAQPPSAWRHYAGGSKSGA